LDFVLELFLLSFFFKEYGESGQSDMEEVLGHGTLYQKRKDISPGTCSHVEQVGKCNESSSSEASHGGATKSSSLLSLLDLIDCHSNCDSKSMSQPDTRNSLCASKKNLSVEYLPAGANLRVTDKKSKYARDTKSTCLRNKQKPAGVRNSSYPIPLKITNNCDTVLGVRSSQSTNAPLDTDSSEVQSPVKKRTELCDKITKKKQQSLMSLLDCLQMEANSNNKNDSCRTENIGGVPCDITKKETSVSTRNFFQVVGKNVENSTQAKREKVFDGMKNNSVSPNNIPDMKAKQHNAARGAVLKQETSGNDTHGRSVDSLVR
jgi:hypothetical protein